MNNIISTSKDRIVRAQDLFYGLFAAKIKNGSHSYYVDGVELPHLTWQNKVRIEIKHAIRELARGELLGHTPVPGGRGRFQFRAVAMLVWVYHYLQNKQSEFNSNEFCDVSLKRGQPSSEQSREWLLSRPLLLVQAARLSQWEWDHHQYCFEYFTARRAWSYLDDVFDALDCQDEYNQHQFQMRLATLLRWQTLAGQYARGSANFGIKDLKTLYEIYEIPQPIEDGLVVLLKCLAGADSFFKKGQNKIEKGIVEYVKKGGNVECLIDLNFNYDDNEAVKGIKQRFETDVNEYIKRGSDREPKSANGQGPFRIYSYIRLPQHASQKDTTDKFDGIKDVLAGLVDKGSVDKLLHIAFDRRQRNVGVLQKCPDADNSFNDQCIFMESKDPNELEWCVENDLILPPEDVFRFALYPHYAAKVLYLPKSSRCIEKEDIKKPMAFLDWAFTEGKKYYGNILPLPLVKRLTDLMEAFNLDKDLQDLVFPAHLRFTGAESGSKEDIRVWLPTGLFETEPGDKKEMEDRIKEPLIRLLAFLVSNVGMTRGFKQVDMDLRPHATEGEITINWFDLYKQKAPDLGMEPFKRYYEDCGSNIVETTDSELAYRPFIKDAGELDIKIPFYARERIEKKKVLGIDIGATGIKCAFYTISASGQEDEEKEIELKHDFSCSFPTRRIGKDKVLQQFSSKVDFAKYLIDQIEHHLNEEIEWENVIALGCAWPGPIRQYHIASTSKILSYFEGFTNKIKANQRDRIIAMDIPSAIAEEIAARRENGRPTVILTNDGDAEAAGLFSDIQSKKKNLSAFLKSSRVGVFKAGTGLAGAVVHHGHLRQELNEFGKLIVDMAADNSPNNGNSPDDKWPQGDANKLFSMGFLRQEMKCLGVPADSVSRLTGYDIELCLEKLDNLTTVPLSDDIKQNFGVISLCQALEPDVEWSGFMEQQPECEPKVKLKENIHLVWDKNRGFDVKQKEDWFIKDRIDHSVWSQLARNETMRPWALDDKKPNSLHDLLVNMGDYRIACFNLLNVVNCDRFQKIGERMGGRAAGVVATVNDIYQLDAVVLCGGPLNGEELAWRIENGFKDAIKAYLFDGFHFEKYEGSPEKNEESEEANPKLIETWEKIPSKIKPDEIRRRWKLVYLHQKGNNGVLGAAVLGLRGHITEQKVDELRQLFGEVRKRKDPEWKVKENFLKCKEPKHSKFLSLEEARDFLLANVERLNATVYVKDKDIEIRGL